MVQALAALGLMDLPNSKTQNVKLQIEQLWPPNFGNSESPQVVVFFLGGGGGTYRESSNFDCKWAGDTPKV